MQKSAKKKRITPVQVVLEEETEQLEQPQTNLDPQNNNNSNANQQLDDQFPKQQPVQQQISLQPLLPILQQAPTEQPLHQKDQQQQQQQQQQQLLPVQQPPQQQQLEEEADMYGFDENTADFTQKPQLMIRVDLSECAGGCLDWKEEMKKRDVNWYQITNSDKASNRENFFQRTLHRLENQNMEISEDEEMQGEDSENIENMSDVENNVVEGSNNNEEDRKKRKKDKKADEYDYDDGFLDDSTIFKHLNREKLKTKYEGYFVYQGPIETISDQPEQGTQKQKKAVNKSSKRKAGGEELQQQEGGQKKKAGGAQAANNNNNNNDNNNNQNQVEIQGTSTQQNKEQESQQQQQSASSEDGDFLRPTSAESNQALNEEDQNGSKNEGAGPSKEIRSSKKQAKEFEIPDDLLISIKEVEKVATDLPPPDPNKKNLRYPNPIVKELTNLTPLYFQTCGNNNKAKEKVVNELMKTLEPWFKDNKKLKSKLSELQRKDGKEETQIEVSKTDLQNTLRAKSEQLRKQQEHWDEQVQEKIQRYVDCLLKVGKQIDWNLLVGIWAQENLSVDVKFLQGKVKFQSQQQQQQLLQQQLHTQVTEGEN